MKNQFNYFLLTAVSVYLGFEVRHQFIRGSVLALRA